MNVFMGKAGCATCHFPPTYSGLLPRVSWRLKMILGVTQSEDLSKPQLDTDEGMYRAMAEMHRNALKQLD